MSADAPVGARHGYTEFRADGWPLCPRCGEDELWSRLFWDGNGGRPPLRAYIDAGLTCYRCGFYAEPAPPPRPNDEAVTR